MQQSPLEHDDHWKFTETARCRAEARYPPRQEPDHAIGAGHLGPGEIVFDQQDAHRVMVQGSCAEADARPDLPSRNAAHAPVRNRGFGFRYRITSSPLHRRNGVLTFRRKMREMNHRESPFHVTLLYDEKKNMIFTLGNANP